MPSRIARISGSLRAARQIVQWSEAYPLDIFPEPDWKKAAALLKGGGMTLDSISAACMRHVVEGVSQIASPPWRRPSGSSASIRRWLGNYRARCN